MIVLSIELHTKVSMSLFNPYKLINRFHQEMKGAFLQANRRQVKFRPVNAKWMCKSCRSCAILWSNHGNGKHIKVKQRRR